MYLGEKSMVIVAHPDDEVLGAGGLISSISSNGAEVHVAIVSPRSILSRPGVSEDYVSGLIDQAMKASKVLGAKNLIFGNFDRELTAVRETEVNLLVNKMVNSVCPDTIITHPGNELHNDHNIVSKAVSIAARPRGGRKKISVLQFEQIGVYPSSDFWPNFYVTLTSEDIECKVKAMECYNGELQKHPNDWRTLYGIRARANLRGLECGSEFAEAYRIFRSYYDTSNTPTQLPAMARVL